MAGLPSSLQMIDNYDGGGGGTATHLSASLRRSPPRTGPPRSTNRSLGGPSGTRGMGGRTGMGVGGLDSTTARSLLRSPPRDPLREPRQESRQDLRQSRLSQSPATRGAAIVTSFLDRSTAHTRHTTAHTPAPYSARQGISPIADRTESLVRSLTQRIVEKAMVSGSGRWEWATLGAACCVVCGGVSVYIRCV
jgi:hypothetical protein